ncbi:MAG: response regulator [Planctomycetales bacterium]|nr:response regulator [Planctomycetales bacterium]
MSQAPMSAQGVILLIEDNLADQEMYRRALGRVAAGIDLQVVEDGEQAIDYLLQRDLFADGAAPRPDLVVLDLNLPKLSGKDIIRRIRGDETMRHLPLIVMTTSHAEEDVLESYQLGCNAYILKPSRFDHYVALMERLTQYWFSEVQLPRP